MSGKPQLRFQRRASASVHASDKWTVLSQSIKTTNQYNQTVHLVRDNQYSQSISTTNTRRYDGTVKLELKKVKSATCRSKKKPNSRCEEYILWKTLALFVHLELPDLVHCGPGDTHTQTKIHTCIPEPPPDMVPSKMLETTTRKSKQFQGSSA